MKNVRLTHFLAFLRLLSPANFMHSFSYLKKYGVRLCFARVFFLLSLALGRRRSTPLLAFQPAFHKVSSGGGCPLKLKVPDAPPPLPDAGQNALKIELAAIKDGLAGNLRGTRKING